MIFAILVFGGVFGILGMFLGVPVFAVTYSICKTWLAGRLEKRNMPVDTSAYASQGHPLLEKKVRAPRKKTLPQRFSRKKNEDPDTKDQQ